MSTKTTFKRIALVAVAALGLGVLTSVAPANAALVPTVGASSGFSLNTTSITLVDDAASATVIPANAVFGAFEVSVANSNGYANTLRTGESLTATVIANPNGAVAAATANAYIKLAWASAYTPQTGAATSATYGVSASIGSADSAYAKDLNLATALRGGTGTSTDYTVDVQAGLGAATATYALMVAASDTAALNAGFYTIRIDLLDANKNAIKSSTVKFQVVTSKVNSGAVVTTTVTGSQLTAAALATSATQNITATLADANGGLVRTGANAAPSLSGSITDATTVPVIDSLTWTDAGTDADTDASILDGVYGATSGTLAGAAGAATAKAVFGAASSSAALVLTSASGSGFGNTTISATGQVATASGNNWNVPLTTKSATATLTLYSAVDATAAATTRVGSQAVYYTLAYSAGCVLGDMAPAAVGTPTKATTDANGQVAIAMTNANPIAGCSATVTFTGSGVATTPTTAQLARVINWVAPAATTVVKSPAGSYSAVLASTHKVTWTILDQFSAPIVGSTVTFSHTGANKPAATTTAPSAISDANGQVSYTFTDAKGVVDSTTLGSDTVALANIGLTAAPAGTSIKVTYVATMPAITSLYATYTATNAAGTTITGLVPTTAIGGSTVGILTSAADQVDSAKVQTGASTGAMVQLNFQARKAAATAGTSGVPTTVTVTGAQLIGNDGKLGTSVIVYANENVHVLGTKAGTATVTATNGTIVSTATINFINAATDARVLKLTEAAGLVTATVTDAFGSAVKGVDVDVVGSGGAWLGNGSTSASFKTATDGTVTFQVTNAGTVTASLAATYTKASFLAGAGNTTGTVVTTGAPAGVRSASVASAGYNVTADAAQAAADAAAEATDAANAATDAANAAAEAADAATAAAQDAADAVAALATSVEAMISDLKKQITALTNLIIKIQKKVKA